MAAAADESLEPTNWVIPEVLKPDDRALLQQLTRSSSPLAAPRPTSSFSPPPGRGRGEGGVGEGP